MLKRVGFTPDETGACVAIGDAAFPAPFKSGLEYGAPARGVWNIVHVGMLIPQAHQVFVCAGNCLRGVVLTAAEMGAEDRFSTVTIKENNVLDGDMEELIIEGVTDILSKLPYRPKAVLLYTSCIHHFMGCDLPLCYKELRRRFPGVDFTDCYMNPIMRKSGLTPDQLMRRQLYSLIKPQDKKDRAVNILGNCFSTDDDSELCRIIRSAGYEIREISRCKSYADYQLMGKSELCVSYNPPAAAGAESESKRLGQKHLYLPISYTFENIKSCLSRLAEALGTEYDGAQDEAQSIKSLMRAKQIIGDMPIAVDYTVTPAPISLARLLLEYGFNVQRVYIDSVPGIDEDDFKFLKENYPELKLCATVHAKMRVLPRDKGEFLAIGQKAAYFTGTKHFVNIVEGGGAYGFEAINKMCELMEEAYSREREPADYIQQKGWGCSCCL